MDENFRNKAASILKKFQIGTATKEEQHMVKTWFEQNQMFPTNNEEISYDKERLYQKIVKEIEKDNVKIIQWKRWLLPSVAAILLVFAAGIYQFLNNEPTISKIATRPLPNDVLPGRNQATLVLPDGREIELTEENKNLKELTGLNVDFKAGKIFIVPLENGNVTGTIIQSIKTPNAGQYTVVLPDESEVKLNANSIIYFPERFTDERRVTLSGEAFFRVKRDVHRKFIVNAGFQEVEVLGTEFNVKSYPEESKTITALVSGRLKVKSKLENDHNEFILNPGDMAINGKGKKLIVQVSDINKERAWQSGEFYFDGDNLEEVLAIISRWYDVKFVYDFEPSETSSYGGIISRNKKLSTVLELLEEKENLKFEIKGKEVHIKKIKP